jgi:hypothetical protein
VLLVRVPITNPHSHEVPMYRWSNIAVPESMGTRVIAPAESAYRDGTMGCGLRRISIPRFDGTHYTHSTRLGHSAERESGQMCAHRRRWQSNNPNGYE